MPKGYRIKKTKGPKDKKQDMRIAKLERYVGKPEVKVYSSSIASSALTANTMTIDYLHLVPPGIANRVGVKVKAQRLILNVQYFADAIPPGATSTLQTIRSLLFKVGNNNQATLTAADILDGSTSLGNVSPPAFPSVANPGSVRSYLGKKSGMAGGMIDIMKDRHDYLSYLNNYAAAGLVEQVSSTQNPPAVCYRYDISFPKGHEIVFDDATTDPPGITDTILGGIGLASLTTSADVSYLARWVLLYTDC